MYYEGFVDDLESVLDYHKVVTVTTYGTRKSRKFAGLGNHIEGKENESPNKQKHEQQEARLYWSKTEAHKLLEFDGVPFSIGDVKTLDCQFGEKYVLQTEEANR